MTEIPRPLSGDALRALEEECDPEARFRSVTRPVAILSGGNLFLLSVHHYHTAGFGIPRATTHRGLHPGVSPFVIFLSFSGLARDRHKADGFAILGVPATDRTLAIGGAVSAFYDPLQFRVGNPLPIDIAMGTMLLVVVMEAVRRLMGWPLPVTANPVIACAYFGRPMPAILGTISGSPVANTVTTGALAIPAMIKIGFKRPCAAVAALVGVVIGILTLIGVGLKIAFMVTSVAAD